jgi:hypothetical protein
MEPLSDLLSLLKRRSYSSAAMEYLTRWRMLLAGDRLANTSPVKPPTPIGSNLSQVDPARGTVL